MKEEEVRSFDNESGSVWQSVVGEGLVSLVLRSLTFQSWSISHRNSTDDPTQITTNQIFCQFQITQLKEVLRFDLVIC